MGTRITRAATFSETCRAAELLSGVALALERSGSGWDLTIASLLRLNAGLRYNRAAGMLASGTAPVGKDACLNLMLLAGRNLSQHLADKERLSAQLLPVQSPKDRIAKARAFVAMARDIGEEGNPELLTYQRPFRAYAADLLAPLPALRPMSELMMQRVARADRLVQETMGRAIA